MDHDEFELPDGDESGSDEAVYARAEQGRILIIISRSDIRAVYVLCKPGIVYGNALHTVAGVFLAYRFGIDIVSAIAVVIGSSLVIASACIVNNYIDRDLDRKMARTKTRPSVTNRISLRIASVIAIVLLAIGIGLLVVYTNWLTVALGVIAYVFYVAVYAVAKRKSVHGTLVGAVPGALPAVAGYVAITGQLNISALLIFVLIVAWQMPHFYAISLFRRSEYKQAGVPVLGAVRSPAHVRRAIIGWIGVYILVLCVSGYMGILGVISAAILFTAALWWLESVCRSFTTNPEKRARIVFGRSLVLTLLFFGVSILNSVIS